MLPARSTCSAPQAFNLRGRTVPTRVFVETLRSACASAGVPDFDVAIADEATSMPFVCDLDDSETLAVFPRMPLTSLEEGLAGSVERFQAMVAEGTLVFGD